MTRLLIVAIMLVGSFISQAQESNEFPPFVRSYRYVVAYDFDVKEFGETKKADNVFCFNYDHRTHKLVSNSGDTYLFHQIGGVTAGTTDDGVEYQEVNCMDGDGLDLKLQLFDEYLLFLTSTQWLLLHNNSDLYKEPEIY